MTFLCHFWQPNLPPWPFANWTAKSSRPNKSLFKPHLGSQAKGLINRGWSLMRRHSLFFLVRRRISSGRKQCVCVCVWKSAFLLTNEGCWFLLAPVCFWRQLSPHCSLSVSLKRRDWEIIWENVLCGLSTLAGLRYILLSYGKACLSLLRWFVVWPL